MYRQCYQAVEGDGTSTFKKICIRRGLAVDGEIKTPERDRLSVLEYKAKMRKQEIQKLETQEKEVRETLRNLQSLIKQAEEKLEETKKDIEDNNPDGTVAGRDPGWGELFDFEIKFGEYREMKSKNDKTEDILKELDKPELHNRMKR